MKKKAKWIPVVILVAAACVALGGWVVMSLWNWLLPPLFGWHALTFWQALGILVLCRIRFGRWGGGHKGPAFRRGPGGWKRMSEEEKQEWRNRMRERCGMSPEEPAPSA